jgi:hypothetical protein
MHGLRIRSAAAALAVALALALGGCGVSAEHVLGNAAKLTNKITQLSQRLLTDWCPPAFTDNARHLTPHKARSCLTQAKNSYLGILHRNGYDPKKIVNGGG